MIEQNKIFSNEEQIEIIRVVKGIFLFAKKGKNVLEREKLLLELLNKSCNSIVSIIKGKEDKDYANN